MSIIRLGLCAAALWGGSALAQERETPIMQEEQVQVDLQQPQQINEKRDHKGLYVFLGGGVEGYTGALAPTLNPGPAWGATVGFKPWQQLGLEAQYSGAVNDLDAGFGPGGAINGADVVRQGGQVAAVVDLTRTAVRPYAMAGIGIENFNVRGGDVLAGFEDDTSGYVPAGVGVRYKLGSTISLDARVNYNFGFERDFTPPGTDLDLGDNRYQGLLQLGGVY